MNEPTVELRDLCAAAAEDRLTDAQTRRLEELVLGSPAALRFYTSFLHQHAALTWSAADPVPLSGEAAAVEPASRRRSSRTGWVAGFVGLAASVVLAVGWFASTGAAAVAKPVATLTAAKACKWDGGTLPTEEGARLTAGKLRLAEGVAKITFDTGAEVRLEGPAELQIVSPGRCVLASGRVVAKVPPPAIGFVVDTPSAELTDFGTEFGVNVRDGRAAEVQVFDGVVDARDRTTGKVERMRTGKNLRFSADGVASFDPNAEPPAPAASFAAPGSRVVTLTSATGAGKDRYVQPKFPSDHSSDVLILVKNSLSADPSYLRKGYVGIDLSALAGQKIADARFDLTLAPTGLGFASEVPDATFTVYGMTDDALDGWDESGVRWATAPGNAAGGAAVDPGKTVKLGQFVVPQGVQTGVRSVDGPALVEFLNRNTNRIATFVVVRDTPGSGRQDLVHGFASRRHPTLPPPTLRLALK
jgi:ferric-dicitrate binding protein FerR (iron transport regulator)